MNYIIPILITLTTMHFLAMHPKERNTVYEETPYVIYDDAKIVSDTLRVQLTNINIDHERTNDNLYMLEINEQMKNYEEIASNESQTILSNLNYTIDSIRREIQLGDLFLNSYNMDKSPFTNWMEEFLELGVKRGYEKTYTSAVNNLLMVDYIHLPYLILLEYLSHDKIPIRSVPPKNTKFWNGHMIFSTNEFKHFTDVISPKEWETIIKLDNIKSDEHVFNSILFSATNNLNLGFFQEFEIRALKKDLKHVFDKYLTGYKNILRKELRKVRDIHGNVNRILLEVIFYNDDRLPYKDEYGFSKMNFKVGNCTWVTNK